MKVFLALVCLVGATLAQERCSVPSEITGRAFHFHANREDFMEYYLQYDAPNQRAWYGLATHPASGPPVYSDVWYLWKEHIGYMFHGDSQTCMAFTLPDFRIWKVPDDATYVGQYTVGGPGELVSVDIWNDKTSRKRVTWEGDFTVGNCYPVTNFAFEDHWYNQTVWTNYFNIVKGIVHPDAWYIPPVCRKTQVLPQMPMEAYSLHAAIYGPMRK